MKRYKAAQQEKAAAEAVRDEKSAKTAKDVMDSLVLFKGDMGAYVRLYAFLSDKVNGLFEGELTDDDQLVYVNGVLKGKLLENQTLVQQAASNSKEQFANSPDLKDALLHAIMDALEAHNTMSTQALGSEGVRDGLRDILLGPGQLYEGLRERSGDRAAGP